MVRNYSRARSSSCGPVTYLDSSMPQKGTPVHKYLKELEEVFEQFLLDHMSDYWQHLDGESSS